MGMLNANVSESGFAQKMTTRKWNVFSIQSQRTHPDSILNLLSSLRSDSNVAYASPFLVYKDGTLQGLTDQVIVRVKPTSNPGAVNSAYRALGVYIIEPNPYLAREFFLSIHPTATMDALDVANSLYGTGLFEYSEPDFVKLGAFRVIKPLVMAPSMMAPPPPATPNDPLFPVQWNLQNTGQIAGSTAGADIKAPQAWCSSTGTGIRVAIIDEGVDLVQPDLQANMVAGYDALGQGTNGAPTGDDAHGTACAGIAAAISNNNIGLAGVASSAHIVPVRVGQNDLISNSVAATGIGWAANAAQGNADVLSCSWGGGSSSSSLNSAIASAISSGRGGKGCVVLFASGNDGGSSISYPSNQPNVIAVGGTNMCDQRFNITPTTQPGTCNYDTRLAQVPITAASDYGTGLGVVAPGINIPATDISGQPGFSNQGGLGWVLSGTNYVQNFDGTSAACPQAAAVIALILSVNPSLTYSQATAVLESTCAKVGGYNYSSYLTNGYWNNEMGYGRIDAAAAVAKALSTLKITGPSYICSGSANYSVTPPAAVTTTWSVSNGSATLSCTVCNTTTVTAVSRSAVVLYATFSNACGAIPGLSPLQTVVQVKQNPLTETNVQGSCFGSQQQWTLSLAPGSQGSNYNWYVSYLGTNSSIYIYNGNTAQATANVTGGGTVSVTYTDICGAQESNGATVYSTCGHGAVALTPNPASNSVTIVPEQSSAASSKPLVNNAASPDEVKISTEALNSTTTTNNSKIQGGNTVLNISMIRIFDASGKLRKQFSYPIAGSAVTLDVSDLASGIYYVQILDGKNLPTIKKLVIMK